MSTPTKTQALPTLPGISKEAADQIRVLAQTAQRLQARVTQLEGAGFLTKTQADAHYSPAVMAQQLSANGSAPLNVVMVSGRIIVQAQPMRKTR
jgi:hypothetical protein